jgi:hypothetical protein
MKAAPGNRSIDLVVVTEFIAYDEKVVITLGSICAARPAPKKNNGAGMQGVDKTADSLLQSWVLDFSAEHLDG